MGRVAAVRERSMMRYSMLVYITKMGRTLLEAARYLRTAREDGLRLELLDNGQQMLAQIRDVLERHRKDLRSETLLDKLTELEGIWQNQSDGLEAGLEQFIQSLPDEIAYQVRAVFFAEIGEKWDAMESVYEYMRDAPQFDPVVVRTPVGRVVERDGKREQEIIYRDFLTPMGVPSLSYDEYDIDADCPELAFISQPYESCTLEQFWPEKIAEHAKLVYLFYYVPCLIFEESPQSLCRMPVYRYAWKVMGMSERHKRYYRKYAHNGGANMLVTGIPKLDPVTRLKENGMELPHSWLSKIKGKKVILWNTWYDNNGSALRYFDAVIRWFQTHEDCALIWRPHPMTDTVTKLYYPAEIYAQLLQRIALVDEMPNGIYDREVSCDAAFACSDAQISDYSSLMFQYLLLDKPVLWTKAPHGTSGPYSGMKNDYIIDWRWMEEAQTEDDVLQFLERIWQGIDKNKELRRLVLKRDVPLADGRCGERVCQALLDAMHREDMDI